MRPRRFFGIWVLLAVVMSANGVLRELFVVKVVGRSKADVASAGLGVTAILGVTKLGLKGAEPMSTRAAAQTGLTWAGMAMAFDLVVGHYVDHKSWGELFGNYAIWRGRLWPAVLLTVVAAPVLWTRRSGE